MPPAEPSARSCAVSRMDPSSHAPLMAKVFADVDGGLSNGSMKLGMPRAAVIGAGEMAIVAATGIRAATNTAIAPPIECPATIVRAGSIAPRAINWSVNDSAHAAERANENGPGVHPCPGKSGTNTRRCCSANPCAR